MAIGTAPGQAGQEPTLLRQMTWWVLVLPLATLAALLLHSLYLLDYAHVLSGTLWTGADIFLGFILGPVLRRLGPEQRRAVIGYLVPRMLLYLPIVALTTATAGWFLASWLGFVAPASPDRAWIFGALAITTVLAILGLGILLPNNLRIYGEMRSGHPDTERMLRLSRSSMRIAALQGALQLAVILIMAHLVMS